EGFRLLRKPGSFKRSLPQGDIRMDFTLNGRELRAQLKVVGKPTDIKPSAYSRTRTLTDRAINMASANLNFIDEYRQRLRLGRIDEALAPLSQHLETQPDDGEAHARLGSLYASIGRVYKARHHLERAIELNPKRFKAYEDLAATWMTPIGNTEGTFNHDEIKRIYDKALENVYDRREVLTQLSRVFTFSPKGRQYAEGAPMETSLKFLDVLTGMDERNLNAWFQKFDILLNMKRYEDADEIAVRMAEINAYDHRTRAAGWFSAAMLGNPDYAMNLLNNTYNDAQQRSQQTFLLGGFLLRHERYSDAAVLFRALAPLYGEKKMENLADLLEGMEPDPDLDVKTYFKTDTPDNTARTFAIAMLDGDIDRLSRCMSRHIATDETLRQMKLGARGVINQSRADRYMAQLVLEMYEVETRPTDDENRMQVLWRTRSEIDGFNAQLGIQSAGLTYHMVKEDEAWKIYSIINEGPMPSLLAQMADGYARTGDYNAAAPILEEMYAICGRSAFQGAGEPRLCRLRNIEFSSDEDRVQAHIAMGLNAFDPELGPRKLELLDKICSATPDEAILHVERSGVLAALDQRVKSAEAIQTASKLEPENQQYRYALIGALIDAERYNEAEKWLIDEMEKSPQNPGLLALQFRLHRQRHELQPAKTTLRKLQSAGGRASRSTHQRERIDIALLEKDLNALRDIEKDLNALQAHGFFF
ncbi:MAG: hypothetical protein AAF492_12070, partial [Verrucomicrobiota bacterium]